MAAPCLFLEQLKFPPCFFFPVWLFLLFSEHPLLTSRFFFCVLHISLHSLWMGKGCREQKQHLTSLLGHVLLLMLHYLIVDTFCKCLMLFAFSLLTVPLYSYMSCWGCWSEHDCSRSLALLTIKNPHATFSASQWHALLTCASLVAPKHWGISLDKMS